MSPSAMSSLNLALRVERLASVRLAAWLLVSVSRVSNMSAGQRGEHGLGGVEALLEAGDSLADAAEGEVVGFLILFDDALQQTVGHMAVARAQSRRVVIMRIADEPSL